jgi:hypothetical protein
MHRLRVSPRARILTFTVAALIAFAVGTLPAVAQSIAPGVSTCPLLDLANPSAGDLISPGSYIVDGTVIDPVTFSPSGISHVEFFLGARDQGGTILGSTVPGTSPTGGPNAFQVTLSIPDVNRDDNFTAYAYATHSDAVTTVQREVHVGHATTGQTTVPLSITLKSNCPVVNANAQATAITSVPVITIVQGQGPVLQLANPNANDSISRGAYVVTGLAYDPASTNGAGISGVEFFLDERDQGGQSLGGTTVPGTNNPSFPRLFRTVVTIPSSASGGHTFVAYAQSSLTGLETKLSVPVTVHG